jgi:outer membrane lipoprotein-sorting protein
MKQALTKFLPSKGFLLIGLLTAGLHSPLPSISAADVSTINPGKTNIHKIASLMGSQSHNWQFVDGAEFIKALVQTTITLKSYSFKYHMKAFKGSKVIDEQGNFYFKQPRLMRVEETGDFRRGSVAVLNKEGKLRGHMGGPLKFVVVTLNPDSSQAKSANNYPVIDSDLLSLNRYLEGMLKRGFKSRVTAQPTIYSAHPQPAFVLELYKEKNGATIVEKRIIIDKETNLPVEWQDYSDGKLYSISYWSDMHPNIELSDKLFEM